jgi:hypothetical protein
VRIAIAGWPRAGKTTLAETFVRRGGGYVVRHTDDLIGQLGWSEASAEVAHWFDEPGPFIIEGVAVLRALRKWRAAHPGEPPPIDRLYYLPRGQFCELARGQESMGKGCDMVLDELREWLEPVPVLGGGE